MRLSLTTGSRRRTRLGALGTSAALILGLSAVATTVSATAVYAVIPAAQPGFTLTWSDEFSGAAGSGVPSTDWKYDTGTGFGTGEIETMTSSASNVYEDGAGHLVIKASKNSSGNWTSGRIETQSSGFGAPAGGVVRIESVIQQPNVDTNTGAGYWPAFWTLGAGLRAGGVWPSIGVVDIFEDINGRSSVFGTLHCGVNPGGPCNESTGIGSGEHACAGCQTGFHDYAVEIDRSTSPEQIRYYLDGANYFTINANQVDATTWANAVDHNFFIIYDLAMGGGFPNAFGGGPTSSTASGGAMIIDSVAVYNKAPSTGGVANIAQGKPATASSTESVSYPASNTTDGNAGTRWSSAFADPQWLQVDLGQTYNISQVNLNWEAAYARAFQIQTSGNGTNWNPIYSTTSGTGGDQTLSVAGTGRYIRMYGTTRATPYGYSLREFGVQGTLASSSTLLSQGQPATASSVENPNYVPAYAVDGNTGTRWSSANADPQWLQVDLGTTHTLNKVVLNWEAAYANAYQIQTSNDTTNWTTVYSTTNSTGGLQTLNVAGSGRYVRMYGQNRATPYGYSLWEFRVYGT